MFFILRSCRFLMSKLSVAWLLLTIALVASASCFSLPGGHRAVADQAMNLMLNCEFDSALYLCDSLAASDPSEPMADMLKLAVMGFLDLDCNHVSDSIRFYEQLSRAERAVFAYETKNGRSSYSLTIKGFNKAVAACYLLWHKTYIKGLNSGFEALGILREAKKRDPTNFRRRSFSRALQLRQSRPETNILVGVFLVSRRQGIRHTEPWPLLEERAVHPTGCGSGSRRAFDQGEKVRRRRSDYRGAWPGFSEKQVDTLDKGEILRGTEVVATGCGTVRGACR